MSEVGIDPLFSGLEQGGNEFSEFFLNIGYEILLF